MTIRRPAPALGAAFLLFSATLAGQQPASIRGEVRGQHGVVAAGRTFTVDDSIAPVRWTVTADYQIDATSEHAAERLAVARYADETEAAGIRRAETVMAATGPLT